MRVVHDEDVDFEPTSTGHRGGNIEFKRILQGELGSVHNYEFLLARSPDHFFSPRHRHNFDQFRLGLEGTFGDGKGEDLKPGFMGYYPEGTYYSIDTGPFELLLIQFGGANGDGFTHYTQLRDAYGELSKKGEFRDGVFFRDRGDNLEPGTKKNQDGYEALWQHIYGKPITYPKPRYASPVLMDPEQFAWEDVPGQEGVSERTVGTYSERGIQFSQLAVQAGKTWAADPAPAPRLLFVMSGKGHCDGVQWAPRTAVELLDGETIDLLADDDMLITVLKLPTFAAHERAANPTGVPLGH